MKKFVLLGIVVAGFIFAVSHFTQAVVPAAGAGAPLATVNSEPVTEAEVMAKANRRMMKLLSEMYNVKKQVIEEIIDDRLLAAEAKKKGVTPDKLMADATKNVTSPTDEEARTIYEMQKNRAFQGKTFEEVRDNIKKQLTLQKRQMAANKYLDSLRQSASVKINLERPSVEVSVDDDPFKGPAGAPITIVEFSEFQCPFCKRARPTVTKVLETYKDKVRYVFRDFPLSFHKEAKPAAIAANCAAKQGNDKYWAFNTKLFDNQQSLGEDLYKKTATEIGLNVAEWEKCRQAPATDAEIDKDQNEGAEVGVSGTPAYFINGKFLSGAQPFPAFKEIIDEELAKK